MSNNQLVKSQRYIRKAFLEMLCTQSFETITVREIVKKAELGRSTFYIYYDDKYDLLKEISTELINGFLEVMLELRSLGYESFYGGLQKGNYGFYVEYFRYIKKHSLAFTALLGETGQTIFSGKLSRAISTTRKETDRIWSTTDPSDGLDNDIVIYRETALSAIYVSLFKTWLERGMDLSEKKMGQILTLIWTSDFIDPSKYRE